MTTPDEESIDQRLARLAGATRALAPPPGLAARIAVRATANHRITLPGVVLPFGRAAVVAAVLAAAAAVLFAVRTDRQIDEAVVQAEGAIWEP